MPAAAFTATYSDWRVIKGRKVVSISFEVPIEHADLAYQVVGGMPDPAVSAWFAIAKLNETALAQSFEDRPSAAAMGPSAADPVVREDATGTNSKSWRELSYAQQAGIRCSNPAFQRFLSERERQPMDETRAAEF